MKESTLRIIELINNPTTAEMLFENGDKDSEYAQRAVKRICKSIANEPNEDKKSEAMRSLIDHAAQKNNYMRKNLQYVSEFAKKKGNMLLFSRVGNELQNKGINLIKTAGVAKYAYDRSLRS